MAVSLKSMLAGQLLEEIAGDDVDYDFDDANAIVAV